MNSSHTSDQKLSQYLSLSEIYADPKLQLPRYESLVSLYEKLYKAKPKYIARAPGRVNLIGEHIDYSGYGVFPFALEQDTLIAFTPNTSEKLSIHHRNSDKYASVILSIDPNADSPNSKEYYNYILAGYKSVLIPNNIRNPVGIDMLVDGNVPVAAGLSSSASIVVCSASMTLIANDLVEKIALNDFTANVITYERAMGPSVGGMDQTISVMGKKNKALYITFDPIRTEGIDLPKDVMFVIGDSLTESKKLLTMGTRYNKRVCECRLAVNILKKALNIPQEEKLINLAQLQVFLKKTHEEMMVLVQLHIKEKGYSTKELEILLGVSLDVLFKDFSNYEVVLSNNSVYFPFERALHVYAESLRVLKFKECCQSSLSDEEKSNLLGKLMDESHANCRDLFECSSDNLEKFVGLAKKNGALGSRLTGAGWGGCAVSLIRCKNLEMFLENLTKEFYAGENLGGRVIEDVLFATHPGSGAGFLEVKNFKN